MELLLLVVLSVAHLALGSGAVRSRSFIPGDETCDVILPDPRCDCHVGFSGLVISCDNLGMKKWPDFSSLGQQVVEYLNLSGNALRIPPPDAFGSIEIQGLDLSNNSNIMKYLTDIPASDLFTNHQMQTLQHLNLEMNSIHKVPIFVRELTGLRSLKVGPDTFYSIASSDFGNKQDLHELYLGRIIKLEGDQVFNLMPNLRTLQISPYPLNHIDINIFFHPNDTDNLRRLETLILKDTNIDLNVNLFSWLPQLHHLEMSDMGIMDPNLSVIVPSGSYPTMTSLILSDNSLIHVPVALLQHLVSLEVLDLSHNEIRSVSNEDFINNPNLIMLDLSHNSISHISHSAFLNLRSLDLNLNNNNLASVSKGVFPADFAHRADMKVHLTSNPLRCSCNNCWIVDLMLNTRRGAQSPFSVHEAAHFEPCQFARLQTVQFYCTHDICGTMEMRESLIDYDFSG